VHVFSGATVQNNIKWFTEFTNMFTELTKIKISVPHGSKLRGGGRRMSTPEFRVGDATANCPPRFCHFKHQILCSLMQKITAVKPIIFTYLIHQHTPLRVKIEKKSEKTV